MRHLKVNIVDIVEITQYCCRRTKSDEHSEPETIVLRFAIQD